MLRVLSVCFFLNMLLITAGACAADPGEEPAEGEGEGEGAGEVAACFTLDPAFADVGGATELMQWIIDGEGSARAAFPVGPGAYFNGGNLTISLSDPNVGGSVALVLNETQTSVAAGSYTCADGSASINVSGGGTRNPKPKAPPAT